MPLVTRMAALQAEQRRVKLNGILECKFLSKTRTVLLHPTNILREGDVGDRSCGQHLATVLGAGVVRTWLCDVISAVT
jgi:hypothetical protein